ncbi:MAG TPA: hypothetical protein VEC06_11360 [Paucimonas sp.]|nr:hypothetical protein [Paucimonas sp.]
MLPRISSAMPMIISPSQEVEEEKTIILSPEDHEVQENINHTKFELNVINDDNINEIQFLEKETEGGSIPFHEDRCDMIDPDSITGVLSSKCSMDKNKFLNDLFDVGTKKLMGYLPVSTIKNSCETDPDKLKEFIGKKGMETVYLGEKDEPFLYAYDASRLQKFLLEQENAEVLKANDWPTDVHAFVKRVDAETATENKLYNLIHRAFTTI